MKCITCFLFLSIPFLLSSQNLQTVFEKSGGTETPTYYQIIDYYKKLDQASPKTLLKTMGMTDAGFPLHVLLISNDGKFSPADWHRQHKVVLLINNGIH